jgi:hypothetical protein
MSLPNQPERNACFLPTFENGGIRRRCFDERLTWLFGIVSLLVDLALLRNALGSVLAHSVPSSLIIVVLFMSIYALVDGIYLLGRALLLCLKPAVFIAPKGKVGTAQIYPLIFLQPPAVRSSSSGMLQHSG